MNIAAKTTNNLATKTIGDLKGHRFFIPSYQRGYRWSKQEVIALLDDLNEFNDSNGSMKYCIQPLIVKERKDGSYEVVDGQQRLTTIYIFMKIVKQGIVWADLPYEIEYDTRKEISEFLRNLSGDKIDNEIAKKYIDCFHIAEAYNAINDWLYNKDKSVVIPRINDKMRQSTFFIWHVLPSNQDPISTFTKVNLGKIPLTNAELIKALILNKDNFAGDDNQKQKAQTEISIKWDEIEKELHDDSFWCFLSEPNESGTRIDLLFELVAEKYNERLENKVSVGQTYSTFYIFLEALKYSDEKAFVKELWEDIKSLFATFKGWYRELNKYHTIGFLLASGVELNEVYALTKDKRKSEVRAALLKRAKKVFDSAVGRASDLADLEYDKKNRPILLLHNIATLVNYRFPFDIYKKEEWDIEHIHATEDKSADADDLFWNLALLNADINRKYKNKPFNEKRAYILKCEKEGKFVPLCTKNVFLKAYTANPIEPEIWNGDDKRAYIGAMKETIYEYLGIEKEEVSDGEQQ
ncbi:hypothetical protein AGMMS49521_0410 [Campylobacterota bacterium]|nr:hypothetical protein AGMMS49521_0410 [Campylobacterota bacterium]